MRKLEDIFELGTWGNVLASRLLLYFMASHRRKISLRELQTRMSYREAGHGYMPSVTTLSRAVNQLISDGYITRVAETGTLESGETEYQLEFSFKSNGLGAIGTSRVKQDIASRQKQDMPTPPYVSQAFDTAWADYQAHRAAIKFPLTPGAARLAYKKLAAYRNEALAIRVLEQSVQNGWRGLFDLKDDNRGYVRKSGADVRREEADRALLKFCEEKDD